MQEYFGTKNFDWLVEEFQALGPLKIKFKDESWEMQLLNVLVFWFNTDFLTRYTTVIGHTIYFPDKEYIFYNEKGAMKTLAHEMVHILDSRRMGMGTFALSYLFPQILAIGVFAFPFIGWWALLFLLFLLPLPAPFRSESEARAYALDVLMAPQSQREDVLDRIVSLFIGRDYYFMNRNSEQVGHRINHWMEATESGNPSAVELTKVLLIYEMVEEG